MDITQVLLLSDFEKSMRVITVALDSYIKLYEIDLEEQEFCLYTQEMVANG